MIFQAVIVAAALTAASPAPERMITVRPTPSEKLFANPCMGWQTFHRPADKAPHFGELPSSVMYVRYYWSQLEKADGVYDWRVLDDAVARAKRAGQTVALRVMAASTSERIPGSPAFLKDLGCRFHTYRHKGAGPFECPDFNDPVFLEKHVAFIKALGKRYNAHPGVCLVDVGSIGLWGEWHMSGTGVPMPTEEDARRIISAYRHAFPDTPLVMQLDNVAGMKFAKSLSMGWRVDCWGDMGGFSKTWCHMRSVYPESIRETGVENLWRTEPVALETCWDMRKWHREGWDIDYILDWALEQHASFINNKSAPLPRELMPKVKKWLLKIGYRFVLDEASWPARAAAGAELPVRLAWSNVGVAPAYYDFRPALALADASGRIVQRHVFEGETFRLRPPGDFTMNLTLPLWADAPQGECQLLVGIADASGDPVVRIAVEGRREDGWQPLGPVEIAPAGAAD